MPLKIVSQIVLKIPSFLFFLLGNIITGPKNFQTNPTKKGLGNTTVGHLFSPVEYGTDPFHRAKEMDIVKFLEFFLFTKFKTFYE